MFMCTQIRFVTYELHYIQIRYFMLCKWRVIFNYLEAELLPENADEAKSVIQGQFEYLVKWKG